MTVVATNNNDGYIFVVGGPCGCGKSSISEGLAEYLGIPFIEGDDVHPAENVRKMSEGIPLTDDDRWGWLTKIADISFEKLMLPSGEQTTHKTTKYAIVGCSALKKKYRDHIAEEVSKLSHGVNIKVVYIFINISIEDSRARVAARKNHYMKPNMVDSQFKILEAPAGEELLIDGDRVNQKGTAIVLDPSGKDKQVMMDEVIGGLKRVDMI
ncbi:gluconokinase [Saccharomycopsis crataegensis]|uniref:Gluconokinase n=1 Tax=Saccharomycopsis crataegensis TaxID=43959 RepID=A0AAV5QW56_9ASCO|nr:gluconokinase [Saccharomycopsis crataegensis]